MGRRFYTFCQRRIDTSEKEKATHRMRAQAEAIRGNEIGPGTEIRIQTGTGENITPIDHRANFPGFQREHPPPSTISVCRERLAKGRKDTRDRARAAIGDQTEATHMRYMVTGRNRIGFIKGRKNIQKAAQGVVERRRKSKAIRNMLVTHGSETDRIPQKRR